MLLEVAAAQGLRLSAAAYAGAVHLSVNQGWYHMYMRTGVHLGKKFSSTLVLALYGSKSQTVLRLGKLFSTQVLASCCINPKQCMGGYILHQLERPLWM